MTNFTFIIGDKLIKAEKVEAYQGYAKRVYAKEGHAVVDLATSELAVRFLNKVSRPGLSVTYEVLLKMAQRDPELFELTADLARIKTKEGL